MSDSFKHKNEDNVVGRVVDILRNSDGLSITDIVKKTKLNRSAVRTALAKLDGAERVFIRKIGMAKVYLINHKERNSIHSRRERQNGRKY